MNEKIPENNIDYSQSGNKIVKWFRNYWYYYKWWVIGIAFALCVLLVCTLQVCSAPKQDISILYAGTFPPADNSVPDMHRAFEAVLPEDYNGDGEKVVDMAMLMIYSEDQIKEIESNLDDDDAPIINRYTNSGEFSKFQNLVVSGEYYVCLLEPWLFDIVNSEGGFVKLSDIFGATPEKAVNDYAIRLSDTELGGYYEALKLLPRDTYLCLRTPGTMHTVLGNGKGSEAYEQAVEFIKAVVEFEAPEK